MVLFAAKTMDITAIQLLVLDVDGVLTDGRISMVSEGESAKAFYVQDGFAIKLWRASGGKVAILSGRSDGGVAQRAAELGIDCVHLDVDDKLAAFETILTSVGCDGAASGYMGDDRPDLQPMGRCGFPIAVFNAIPAVKRAAAYVTRRCGGAGAVAEAVEFILRRQGRWPRSPQLEH